jgi:4-nitrophenyl phosphatase
MIKAVTLDLDGTVYLVGDAIDGAADFVALLRSREIKYLFVTNRANRLPQTIVESLRGMGIPCEEDHILTSSHATANHLAPGKAYVIGEIGLEQALLDKGFEFTEDKPEYVIVSFDREFTYKKLKTACNLIYAGAKFIATNPDKGLATPGGIYPGTGAIVAAVEAGCGTKPVVIGKPEPLILETAASRLGVAPAEILAIGDNLETDVPSGASAGMQTALILTGISSREDVASSPIQPDHIAENYAELTRILESLI